MKLKSKKIVICANTAWNIYNFRSGLIKNFIKNDYQVIAMGSDDDYASRLKGLNCFFIPISIINNKSPFSDLLLILKFLFILYREKPSVYISFTIKPNIYGSIAAHILGIPVINNIAGLGVAFSRKGWLLFLVKKLYLFAIMKSTKVFFQNNEDYLYFLREKLIKPSQATVIPGSGINLQHFCPAEVISSTLMKNVVEHEKPFVFLFVGRLLWDKGVGEFVESARLVKRIYPNAKFRILGFLDVQNPSAIDRQALNSWIDEGIIQYLGSTDNVRPFLSEANCVVLPSYYMEGTPKSLLEAAAMARPIITTDWVGCRNVVDDGVNGFLCRVRDINDLADKMQKIIKLPQLECERMGLAGRQKVEREFDEKIIIQHYLNTIYSCE